MMGTQNFNKWRISHKRACLILLISVTALIESQPAGSNQGCYECSRHLKRGWKNQTCIGNSNDCGSCLEGFQSSDELIDECIPVKSIIVNESKTYFVPQNASVNLECHFDETIAECVWERRGAVVEISGRYNKRNKLFQTKDCSITIKALYEIDEGEWKCSSAATDSNRSISKTSAFLKMIKDDVVTVEKNQQAFVPLGKSVVLKCQFAKNVECVWQRRGDQLEIAGRYKYIFGKTYEKNTKQCSIEIDSTEDIDYGTWSCEQTMDSSTHSIYKSTIVELIKLEKRSIIGSDNPETTTVTSKLIQDSGLRTSSTLKTVFPSLMITSPTVNAFSSQRSLFTTWLVYIAAFTVLDSHFIKYIRVEARPMFDSTSSSCFPCSRKLHREWKQDMCTGETSDCGQCLKGYSSFSDKTDDPCTPLKERGVAESKLVIVPEGTSITLECQFEKPVFECVWEREGFPIQIGDRYQYTLGDEEFNRKDCSLTINGFRKLDVGKWSCYSAATDDSHPIPNISVDLHMVQATATTKITHPSSFPSATKLTIMSHSNVVLNNEPSSSDLVTKAQDNGFLNCYSVIAILGVAVALLVALNFQNLMILVYMNKYINPVFSKLKQSDSLNVQNIEEFIQALQDWRVAFNTFLLHVQNPSSTTQSMNSP